MHHQLLTILLATTSVSAIVAYPRSNLNGPCTGKDGVIGVCIKTASCSEGGGSYINNACPEDPEDVKCCTKPSCQRAAQSGDCRWVDKCDGGKTILNNLCPGPDSFKCCVTNEDGDPDPPAPPSGDLGEKILAKAKEAEGIPYHWAGGNCKGKTGGGFDCSGLVSWAVCQVTGRDLFSEGLRVTRSMYCASEGTLKYKKIGWDNRRAGDAVFFGGECDCDNNPEGIHHVGLMMDSGWTMWNALKTGTNVGKDNFKNWDEGPCEYVIRFE